MNDHNYADTLSGAQSDQETSPIGNAPSMLVGSQYLRSISMDVQNTPEIFYDLPTQPHLGLAVDVTARQLVEQGLSFEVCLVMRAQGFAAAPTSEAPNPRVLYEANLSYAGLFALQGITAQEQIEPLLLVEAPKYLFPALRNALLTVVREAGFPASNIQPVDFEALWHTRRTQRA